MKTSVNNIAVANNAVVNVKPAQVFPLANKIRKEQGCSMKEAYALAKAQLIAEATAVVEAPAAVVETPVNVTTPVNMDMHAELVAKMTTGNVKFTFKNAKGKFITTTGTLDMSKVPTNRPVHGRKEADNENVQVFYDVRHGVYRSYQKDMLVSIDKVHTFSK